jgi:hypothetical protein
MTTSKPFTSPAEKLENEALLAGEVSAGALRGIEIAAVVLVGLLVCPPLAILVVLVVVPLAVIALVLGLLVAVVSTPYLVVHHLRGHHDHQSLLRHRLHRAGRAVVDLAPHRIVADARKSGSAR